MATVDGKMERYIAASSGTISSLTQKIAALEGKVNSSENNYIASLRKMNDLEMENKDLKRLNTVCTEKIIILESQITQLRKSYDDNDQNFNRRLMNLEGEHKEVERRLDRTNRSDAESKITGNAELQMMQTRVNTLAEEMRMSIENGKRWADQERERTNREMTENIREHRIHIDKEHKELKNYISNSGEQIKNTVDLTDSTVRKVEDKIKQIIDRIKENEIHQRDKYQTAKLSISAINENVDAGMENLRGTVENLYKILDGKVTLTERELKGAIADLKKLIVLADAN